MNEEVKVGDKEEGQFVSGSSKKQLWVLSVHNFIFLVSFDVAGQLADPSTDSVLSCSQHFFIAMFTLE